MTMFWYYAFHTIKNSIKKIFKTWVLVFILACALIGGLIGMGASYLFDEDETEEPGTEIVEEMPPEAEIPEISPEQKFGMMELIVGGITIVMMGFFIISSDKNGSAIFQPADVNLLFPSPLKPQSVLMFRMVSKLGAAVFSGIYMLFQLPNLTLNLGLSIWAALCVILAWSFLLIFGELIQIFLYSIATTYIRIKPKIRPTLYAAIGVIGVSYFAFWKLSGKGPLEAAFGFFNGEASRYIPIWGWIKGLCMYPIEGNWTATAICGLLLVVTAVGLIYLIWHTKADFYEDAMAKSEETAELLAAASDESGTKFVRRKKDRNDKLLRDGMKSGWGANIFFHKAMYNRFRFAHFRVFTKTSETYLVAAIGAALASKFIFEVNDIIIVTLALSALAFFRSMGNPLEQDLNSNYFRMIPENTWKKLFWSLLGGTTNCVLDLIPGMLAATIILGSSPLAAAAWIVFIASIDFYSTNVGTFIAASVPVSAGKTIKQIVQIMFIYFGLIPDIGIIAVGFSDVFPAITLPASIVIAAIFNALIGLIFFTLIPLFIDMKSGKAETETKALSKDEQKTAKKTFSKIGFSIFVLLAIASALQFGLIYLIPEIAPGLLEKNWVSWLITFAPIYLVAVPSALLILRKVPSFPAPEQKKLSAGKLAKLAVISVAMMYFGNLLGTVVTAFIQTIAGTQALNPIASFAMDDSIILKILFLVVAAPVIEEYVFRKQLIDRMRVYGEKTAVVVSALMFGLFHGNLSQFFYAFALGLIFGYVYLKTSKLRYSIFLHMFINFLGSVIGPAMLGNVDFEAIQKVTNFSEIITPGLILFAVYSGLMIITAIVGIIVLCVNARKISFDDAELELEKGARFRTIFVNVGMTLFVLGCVGLIISSLALSL